MFIVSFTVSVLHVYATMMFACQTQESWSQASKKHILCIALCECVAGLVHESCRSYQAVGFVVPLWMVPSRTV